MRKMIALNGKVLNPVIELPDDWTGSDGEWQAPAGATLYDEVPGAAKGDSYDGTTLTKEIALTVETRVSFEDFEARFTVEEFDSATDFVYESDTATGKPKRRALMQGLARAQARNWVDLADNKTSVFLDALVTGGVITSQRKADILTL